MFSLFYLIVPLIAVLLIIFGVTRVLALKRKGMHGNGLSISVSTEDNISQSFLFLSLLFLAVTLFALDRNLADPFSYRAIIFVVSVAALVSAYYFHAVLALIGGLFGVVIWWISEMLVRVAGTGITVSSIILGLLLIAFTFYALGRVHEINPKAHRFSVVYNMLGLLPVVIFSFFASMRSGLEALVYTMSGKSFTSSLAISVSLTIFAAAFLGALFYGAAKKKISGPELIGVLVTCCIFSFFLLSHFQGLFVPSSGYSKQLSDTGIIWVAIFNILIFAELNGLILLGMSRRETWMVNLGAVLVFVLIFVKYFDWFFTLLDRSFFFLAAGIQFFVIGWFLEKGRKYILRNMNGTHPSPTPGPASFASAPAAAPSSTNTIQ